MPNEHPVADGTATGNDSAPVREQYVTTAPSARNALDIFAGEWASRLPDMLAYDRGGEAGLFADDRITWAASQLGGFEDKAILELGPLEAGHTFMIEQLGARSITAIEANTRAYLKCLIVKELLDLKRARFLCGDFVEYLRACMQPYDVCIASGVLYHMRDPVGLLGLLAQVTDRLFLWTHYYDESVIGENPEVAGKFSAHLPIMVDGKPSTLHSYEYRDARSWNRFCGGTGQQSYWMERPAILDALRQHGFRDLRIGFDHPDHPHGPSFALAAIR